MSSKRTSEAYALEDESYVAYVPVKKRREAQLAKLESRHLGQGERRRRDGSGDVDTDEGRKREGPGGSGSGVTLLIEAQEVKRLKAIAGTFPAVEVAGLTMQTRPSRRRTSDSSRRPSSSQRTRQARRSCRASRMLPRESCTTSPWQRRESPIHVGALLTGPGHRWRAPGYIRDRTEEENDRIREKHHILVSGDDVPPPIPEFRVRLHCSVSS